MGQQSRCKVLEVPELDKWSETRKDLLISWERKKAKEVTPLLKMWFVLEGVWFGFLFLFFSFLMFLFVFCFGVHSYLQKSTENFFLIFIKVFKSNLPSIFKQKGYCAVLQTISQFPREFFMGEHSSTKYLWLFNALKYQ